MLFYHRCHCFHFCHCHHRYFEQCIEVTTWKIMILRVSRMHNHKLDKAIPREDGYLRTEPGQLKQALYSRFSLLQFIVCFPSALYNFLNSKLRCLHKLHKGNKENEIIFKSNVWLWRIVINRFLFHSMVLYSYKFKSTPHKKIRDFHPWTWTLLCWLSPTSLLFTQSHYWSST